MAYEVLGEAHIATGKTIHFVDGQFIESIYSLAICQYPGENGILLILQ